MLGYNPVKFLVHAVDVYFLFSLSMAWCYESQEISRLGDFRCSFAAELRRDDERLGMWLVRRTTYLLR